MSKLRVAVIGAGPMGLGAAYQLAVDGREVVVYEAADRIGGMAASFDFGGIPIERYYHFHCTNDVALLGILDELGLADAMHWKSTKMGYFYGGSLHEWGSVTGLVRFPDLHPVDKLRYLAHAFVASRTNDWHRLDRVSAKAWVRDWIGPRAYEILWKQLFELKFHRHADDLSAAWIWSRIRRLARSRDALFRERLGYLEGGTEILLHALENAILTRGGTLHLSAPVERVVVEDGRLVGVRVGGELQRFDAVISTAPLPFAVPMLSDLPAEIVDRYRSVEYLAVVCVIAKLRRPLTDRFWVNVSDPDMDIPGLVEYTNLRPLADHVVYVPYYLPADHPLYAETDDAFEAKVRRYLHRINPGLAEDDVVDVRVHRYRYAQPVCPVGFGGRLPHYALPVRNLFVADTSFYYPEDRGISESIELARRMAREVQG